MRFPPRGLRLLRGRFSTTYVVQSAVKEAERLNGKELDRQSGIYLAPARKPRRMLKILLINVALALGFVLLLLLFLYWFSEWGGVDGDFGKFGVMLRDILDA